MFQIVVVLLFSLDALEILDQRNFANICEKSLRQVAIAEAYHVNSVWKGALKAAKPMTTKQRLRYSLRGDEKDILPAEGKLLLNYAEHTLVFRTVSWCLSPPLPCYVTPQIVSNSGQQSKKVFIRLTPQGMETFMNSQPQLCHLFGLPQEFNFSRISREHQSVFKEPQMFAEAESSIDKDNTRTTDSISYEFLLQSLVTSRFPLEKLIQSVNESLNRASKLSAILHVPSLFTNLHFCGELEKDWTI